MTRFRAVAAGAVGDAAELRSLIHAPAVAQYWRSQEQLDPFARAAMHKRAWRHWNRRVRDLARDVSGDGART